ncbi:MAG: AMP-binding protein [Gammaproteobacteria bacterium]
MQQPAASAPPAAAPARLLTDYYLERARREPGGTAFHRFVGGRWQAITWGAFVDVAGRLAGALSQHGLTCGQRLGIIAPTGLEWEEFQLAALLNGVAVVGLDAHDRPERLVAIANSAALDALVIATPGVLAHIDCAQVPSLRTIISIAPAAAPADNTHHWLTRDALLADADAGALPAPPAPDTLATIVFTSGSTGTPKGIGYTHAQVCLAVDSILAAFPDISASDRLVCWLPLSNLFQRMLNFCAAGRGAQSYFVADPRTIVEHLPGIRPHVFVAVPRFFEKLDEGIEQRLAAGSALSRRVVRWALDVGTRAAAVRRAGGQPGALLGLRAALADRLVLRKLRAVLGGEIRFMVSGSAPFPRWLLEKFHAMGLLVLEAYGLSENVVPIAINRPDAYRFGSVGKVLDANQVEITADGEVLVRGAGVFSGYLNSDRPPPLDARGFLATGDLGHLDTDGFLTLTGRKSEIFKTSTGRKVAPLAIESELKRIAGVDQAVLLGAGHKVPVALVTLAGDPGAPPPAAPVLARHARAIATAAPAALADQPAYAHPAALLVCARPFSIEAGELTSNLKLRRAVIADNYAAHLDTLFARVESGATGFAEAGADDVFMISCEATA